MTREEQERILNEQGFVTMFSESGAWVKSACVFDDVYIEIILRFDEGDKLLADVNVAYGDDDDGVFLEDTDDLSLAPGKDPRILIDRARERILKEIHDVIRIVNANFDIRDKEE